MNLMVKIRTLHFTKPIYQPNRYYDFVLSCIELKKENVLDVKKIELIMCFMNTLYDDLFTCLPSCDFQALQEQLNSFQALKKETMKSFDVQVSYL